MGSQSGHRPLSFPPSSGIRHIPRRTRRRRPQRRQPKPPPPSRAHPCFEPTAIRKGISRSFRLRTRVPYPIPASSAEVFAADIRHHARSALKPQHSPQGVGRRRPAIKRTPLSNIPFGTLYIPYCMSQYLVLYPHPCERKKPSEEHAARYAHYALVL